MPAANPPIENRNTGLLPHELVFLSLLLFAAGILITFLGTPVLRLPGVRNLSPSIQVLKTGVGVFLFLLSVGLYQLWPLARRLGILVLTGGVLASFYPLSSAYIDWEFLWVLRLVIFFASLQLLGFLSRRSTGLIFEYGGLPARVTGFYCGACAHEPRELAEDSLCEFCQGPVFQVLEAPGAGVYARKA